MEGCCQHSFTKEAHLNSYYMKVLFPGSKGDVENKARWIFSCSLESKDIKSPR